MTVGLLNTKGFQNLMYCIRSKAFVEHHEICVWLVVKLQMPMV